MSCKLSDPLYLALLMRRFLLGQPGNLTCNFEPGSPNFYSGEVEYVSFAQFSLTYADIQPHRHSAYNYLLNQTACIIFVVFFGLSTGMSSLTSRMVSFVLIGDVAALHFGQAAWSRQWWLVYTLGFGALGEFRRHISQSLC